MDIAIQAWLDQEDAHVGRWSAAPEMQPGPGTFRA
jgi:hypothetical protein